VLDTGKIWSFLDATLPYEYQLGVLIQYICYYSVSSLIINTARTGLP